MAWSSPAGVGMVAGDLECYPVKFLYTPGGFLHKNGLFDGFGRYYAKTDCSGIPPRHLSRIPDSLKKNMTKYTTSVKEKYIMQF